MEEKRGIPNGTLWGLLILTGYIWSYIGLGLLFFWKSATPGDSVGWIKLIGSSAVYIYAGALGMVPALAIALYFVIRDRNVAESFRNNWPIIGAVLYAVCPDPLPVFDDVVVMGVGAGLRVWFWKRGKKMLEDTNGLGSEHFDHLLSGNSERLPVALPGQKNVGDLASDEGKDNRHAQAMSSPPPPEHSGRQSITTPRTTLKSRTRSRR